MIHGARLLVCYTRSAEACAERQVRVGSATGERPATLFTPRRGGRGQAWVVLHGLTVLGRTHPSMLRFARALASSGHTVVVPEIDEWTRLRPSADAVTEAIVSGADYLETLPNVDPAQVGVIGFSFGATQALVSAAESRAHRVRRVVGFGGYCDLAHLAEFMMTGEHEWRGERLRLDPDPYCRWIVAGNFLTGVPGLEHLDDVARGLLRLAEEAGRGGLYKPDDYVDPFKVEIRRAIRPEGREIWDVFAPPAGQLPADLGLARELASLLARAATAAEPKLEPRAWLARLRARPVLAHGHADRLIPFSETLRLREALPPQVDPSVTITRLFSHSVGAGRLATHRYAVEAWRLLRFFQEALRPLPG